MPAKSGTAKLGSQEQNAGSCTGYCRQQNMVGIAKSQALKRQIQRKEADDLRAYAVEIYTTEQEKLLTQGKKQKSLRQICKDVSDAHFAKTGRRIPLAHNTLARHLKGGVTLTQSN